MIRGLLVRQSLSKSLVINSTPPSVVFFLLIIVKIIFDDPLLVFVRRKLLWWRGILFLLGLGARARLKLPLETSPQKLHSQTNIHLQYLPLIPKVRIVPCGISSLGSFPSEKLCLFDGRAFNALTLFRIFAVSTGFADVRLWWNFLRKSLTLRW